MKVALLLQAELAILQPVTPQLVISQLVILQLVPHPLVVHQLARTQPNVPPVIQLLHENFSSSSCAYAYVHVRAILASHWLLSGARPRISAAKKGNEKRWLARTMYVTTTTMAAPPTFMAMTLAMMTLAMSTFVVLAAPRLGAFARHSGHGCRIPAFG
ncbi:hypothetical protein FGSG_10079 [Fusarium graminearum PH-1]|uniref:Chromosome 1, complete genome n=1 Tax=Gibberella zeae (strain ATCC MYA-4620 / CBS 123657 / FGSC 9075 / NRRL 31084 / PH-1) TaxID=229533 RepID=I1S063_GIBZE|nr:hypothetical protein FGSG_10079 [Fusarium graminearum PH-1]ESU16749.1 hypothetical protein FGSG_10079 [Fusarium graminearum PH-1]CEF75420.1 unnamed protein product [Fusarium graminearum]|eukprot:XP_011319011.1 hypothetical protein FGSG_10079 [Fusarium graminearum PH-1]